MPCAELRAVQLCTGSLRAAACALLAWLAYAAPAAAYCRTSACKTCPRDADTGCVVGGEPLAWPSSCVSFSVQEMGSASVSADDAATLMAEAFAAWSAADCDGAGSHPSIEVGVTAQQVSCEDVGYNQHSGNANVVVFRDEKWPYADASRALAATTVTSNSTGEILDADVEVNTTQPIFIEGQTSAGGIVGAHDLRSIMVHEAGHFLGLDHSRSDEAVMRASLDPGEVRVSLSADDIAAICTAYPPERNADCDDTPKNGFSASCAKAGSGGGCSVQLGAPARQNVTLFAFLCAFFWARGRRRRTSGCVLPHSSVASMVVSRSGDL